MSLITSAVKFLGNGTKYRCVLKGKQIEALPVNLKVLTQNIEKPVVHLGINGRGAEGSMYGIKVFAKGNKQPVAAAAGRIDYRDAEPLLQVKGFVKKNTGTGDALRANVKMNTNKQINLEAMDELTVSKVGGDVSIKAKSEFLDADIKGNNPALVETINLMGGEKIIQKGRQVHVNILETARQKIAYGLQRVNPFAKKPSSKVVDASFEKTAAKAKGAHEVNSEDIAAFISKNKAKMNEQKIKEIKDCNALMKNEADKLQSAFSKAQTEEEKIKLGTRYTELLEKIRCNEAYIRDGLL